MKQDFLLALKQIDFRRTNADVHQCEIKSIRILNDDVENDTSNGIVV